MGIHTIRPIRELDELELKELLRNKNIIISTHAFDHLGTGQRKLFKETELLNTIQKESPRRIFLQENRRYALYYRKREGYLKLILEIEKNKAVIVSFMNTLETPR